MTEAEIIAKMQARVEGAPRRDLPGDVGADNWSHGDLYSAASEVRTACNAIGTLNPRNSGFSNSLIQTGKKLIQRSLSWYTRSLKAFAASVSSALQHHTESISQLAYSVEQSERAFEEGLRETREIVLELHRCLELAMGSVETRARTAEAISLQNREELLRLKSLLDQELIHIRSDVQPEPSELRESD